MTKALGSDFHSTWMDPEDLGYDGPAFLTGNGYFGYGTINGSGIVTNLWDPDGALGTDQPPSGSRYTVYLRTTVTPSQPVTTLRFTGVIDDGVVIYVNGEELRRYNMDPPDLEPDAWMLLASDLGDENQPVSIFAPIALPAGVPATIAVSLHQRGRPSG